jgi:hypothetical protein
LIHETPKVSLELQAACIVAAGHLVASGKAKVNTSFSPDKQVAAVAVGILEEYRLRLNELEAAKTR